MFHSYGKPVSTTLNFPASETTLYHILFMWFLWSIFLHFDHLVLLSIHLSDGELSLYHVLSLSFVFGVNVRFIYESISIIASVARVLDLCSLTQLILFHVLSIELIRCKIFQHVNQFYIVWRSCNQLTYTWNSTN